MYHFVYSTGKNSKRMKIKKMLLKVLSKFYELFFSEKKVNKNCKYWFQDVRYINEFFFLRNASTIPFRKFLVAYHYFYSANETPLKKFSSIYSPFPKD